MCSRLNSLPWNRIFSVLSSIQHNTGNKLVLFLYFFLCCSGIQTKVNLYTDPPANLHIRVQDFQIVKNLILKLNDEIFKALISRGMGGCVEGSGLSGGMGIAA
jgi:hypothetical protein